MKRSYRTVFVALAIFAVSLLAASMVSAATEKVTKLWAYNDSERPSDGWWGAGVDGDVLTTNMPDLSRTFPKGNPSPLGISSAYFRLKPLPHDNSYLMQRWLGTNRYAGTKITDIASLKYSSYVQLRGAETTDHPWYPSQPVDLRILISKDGINKRYIMFRPWSTTTADKFGPTGGDNCQVWKEYDCKANDKYWYICTDQEIMTNWADICARFPNGTICTAAEVGPPGTVFTPTNRVDTATGCALNFVVGAQVMDPNHLNGWWKEANNFEGSMDKFIIRLAGETDETVFDFQYTDTTTSWRNLTSDPANTSSLDFWQYYCMNNRDIKSQLIVGTHCYYETHNTNYNSCYEDCCDPATGNNNSDTVANFNSAGQIIYGWVQSVDYVDKTNFVIDDGSGKLIPVRAPVNTVSIYARDYVRVKGSMAFPQYAYWDHFTSWFPATFYTYIDVLRIAKP